MKLVAVSVGSTRDLEWNGQTKRTSIVKTPVEGRVRVTRLNVEGDRQTNLDVHGGPWRAAYAYPADHYAWWRRELPEVEFPWGAFGENLSIEGLDDRDVRIGDRFRIGTAEFEATSPRMPCSNLMFRFGREDMVKRFFDSPQKGCYFAVPVEGGIGAGDTVERIARSANDLTIAECVTLYSAKEPDPARLRNALENASLAGDWRGFFQRKLG